MEVQGGTQSCVARFRRHSDRHGGGRLAQVSGGSEGCTPSTVSAQGQLVNWITFCTISQPVGICHAKSSTLTELRAMWAERAVLLPFCMAGTSAAASAHSTVMAAPAYRWGPGNSLPEGEAGQQAHNQPLSDGQQRRCALRNIELQPAAKQCFLCSCSTFQGIAVEQQHTESRMAGQQQPTDVALNSPVRRKVLKAPDTEMSTPSPSSRLPQLLCFSFSFCPIRDLRSCSGGGGRAGRV